MSDRARHILSMSGGKDSTALAVYMRDRQPELMARVRDSRDLDDDARESLKAAIEQFKSTFRPSDG